MYTLFSLSFQRYIRGKLDETLQYEQLNDIFNKVAQARQWSPDFHNENLVMEYAQAVLLAISEGINSPFKLIEIVNRFKFQKRQGWEDRGRQVDNTEVVPSHVFMAEFIANVYLPEDEYHEVGFDCDINYSKDRILKLIHVHDLSEAVVGDVPETKKENKHQYMERIWVKCFSLFSDIDGVISGDLFKNIYVLWSEFHCEKNNINAALARDFDKLECLSQLHLYNNNSSNYIHDFSCFSNYYFKGDAKFETQFVRKIAKELNSFYGL